MNMYKKVHSPISGRHDRPCVAVCEVYLHFSTSSEYSCSWVTSTVMTEEHFNRHFGWISRDLKVGGEFSVATALRALMTRYVTFSRHLLSICIRNKLFRVKATKSSITFVKSSMTCCGNPSALHLFCLRTNQVIISIACLYSGSWKIKDPALIQLASSLGKLASHLLSLTMWEIIVS